MDGLTDAQAVAGMSREAGVVGRINLIAKLATSFMLLCVSLSAYSEVQALREKSLDEGWKLQSACVAKDSGAVISSSQFRPTGWIAGLVPGTVLGAQVEAGIFLKPFFGMNLRQIPGTDYPITKIFGYLPMSESSPYHCAWWYRTEFDARKASGRSTTLHFDGINYRANVWLNGKQIANSDQVAGAFRAYDFDVTNNLASSGRNVLAVQVFAQTEKDLGIDFLDWNPAPADKSMGIWRGVSLVTTGAVTVANSEVITHFTDDALSQAELRVVMDVKNHIDHPVTVIVSAQMGAEAEPRRVEQSVTLAAGEARVISFDAEHFPQLRWQHPPIWWPYQYGDPHLEPLRVTATVQGVESDVEAVKFGIREAQSSLNEHGALQFRINRRSILIRGGGWAPDLFYREPKKRLRDELAYVKDMGLNAIRLEGKLGSDEMFNLADEMGILVMAGWQCCDYWQQWEKWTPKDHEIATASTFSQISRLRAHPSLLVWLNGSDEAPSLQAEREALAVLKERDWPNPMLSAAADRTSNITGKSGVKMSGPYDYVPPEYWYLDKDRVGGAFGFNTETGPGPAIPTVATIHETLPKTSWWPMDDQWKYHAGLGKFAQYDNFNNAMKATYGAAANLDEYSLKAQLMAYDGERAMFEAYGANKYRSTGVIQWMLNNAWPSFIWHLYDYNLIPGGGYYGTRKANENIHIQYRYDDRKVVLVNSALAPLTRLTAKARVLDLKGSILFTQDVAADVASGGVTEVLALPTQSATTFLKLELHDESGKLISDNFYWIPATLAQLDWDKSTYVNTPAIHYANMQDLASLSPASVSMTVTWANKPGIAAVHLHNNGSTIAFFLALRAVEHGAEKDIVPIFWEDNYITLMPGETRTLTVSGIPLKEESFDVQLMGWNIHHATASSATKSR